MVSELFVWSYITLLVFCGYLSGFMLSVLYMIWNDITTSQKYIMLAMSIITLCIPLILIFRGV